MHGDVEDVAALAPVGVAPVPSGVGGVDVAVVARQATWLTPIHPTWNQVLGGRVPQHCPVAGVVRRPTVQREGFVAEKLGSIWQDAQSGCC